MNIVGIISELNPFHNGHSYIIKQAKELTDASYVVLVMSGNYVQRGEPAFLEKDFRVKAALLSGADMVIELPTPFATSSAEYFSSAGVALLHQLGCITHLAFGSESGSIQDLRKACSLLALEEHPSFQVILKESLSNGMVYAKAREEALYTVYQEEYGKTSKKQSVIWTKETIHDVLSKPNNALGLSYMQALQKQKSLITPVTIKRIGNAYEDTGLSNTGFSSASGIRAQASNGKLEATLSSIPESCRDEFSLLIKENYDMNADEFTLPLLTKLLESEKEALLSYQDVTDSLADKLLKKRFEAQSFTELAMSCKSKDITYAHIMRALLHVTLGVTKEECAARIDKGYSNYASILGYKSTASELFKQLKAHAIIPTLVRISDAEKHLDEASLAYFKKDLQRDALYQALLQRKINLSDTRSTLWTYESPSAKAKLPVSFHPYKRQVICI